MISFLIRAAVLLLLLLMFAAILQGNALAVVTSWLGFAAVATVAAR